MHQRTLQRIGVVVSLVWVFGSAAYLDNREGVRWRMEYATFAYRCRQEAAKPGQAELIKCADDASAAANAGNIRWETYLLFALAPVLVGWLFGYFFMRGGRD